MTRAQLDFQLSVIPEQTRGSKPVGTGSGTTDGSRFRNHPPNSSTKSAGTIGVYYIDKKSGTGAHEQGPLVGERVFASLSSPTDRETRGPEPDACGEIKKTTPRTSPEPPCSEQPKITLRPYQCDALAAIDREHAAGKRTTLLVLPTGTGKTVVFAELARRDVANRDRVLVLAHRSELLEQAQDKLAAVGVASSLDKADAVASRNASVVVASVQTLRGARLERYAPDAFARVIVDEAHHAASASYQAILERFASARVLGVTATPDRLDGKALGKIFASVAYTYALRAAIRDGYLAPLRARRVTVKDLDLTSVRSHHGDFDQSDLARVLTAEKALHGVVSPLVQRAGDRKSLVFGVDVAHAHALAEVINRHKPGAAIAVDGSAKAHERRAVLAMFARGQFQFLVNCALFTEGFDEPSIACVALARPTQSHALYTQMVGRGTRLHPGKADALILDFVGNSRHRLVSPADALAGRELTPEEQAIAEARLDGDAELDRVLEIAEEQAAAKRRDVRLVAMAVWREREVDPFLGDAVRKINPDSPAGRAPATEAQLVALGKARLKPPAGISKGEASALLDAIAQRRDAGLATLAQCHLLRQFGVDAKNVMLARAQQLITAVRLGPGGFKNKWTLRTAPEFDARLVVK